MTTDKDLMASRIILRAVLPVAKVIFEDLPGMKEKFKGINATFQLQAKTQDGLIGSYFQVEEGQLEVVSGILENPDLRFSFNTPASMNAFLTGGVRLPKIKGLSKPFLLFKFIGLLLGLTLLLPSKRPKESDKIRLKIKMIMYMITTALSQYNKAGDPDMIKWTKRQPDRIYQLSCEPEGIAAYLRIRGGKSKAGRGYYKHKFPFVHMKFNGANNALPVFLNEVEFVDAIGRGYVAVEGSPEYAAKMNDFMQRIQALIT